ncbi:hypothetical protein PanWU01x14_003010 [Parasponia andersonii]|uniref:Uncharacterized protein n=1 Tax=Parasponia andersonii TaxID=3476 RepID=A0A2P5E5B6_PARAD|nr:hypothetical protein PanWU01x14_003010 [Parasponia andersonii]
MTSTNRKKTNRRGAKKPTHPRGLERWLGTFLEKRLVVTIKNFSRHHIDVVIETEPSTKWRFTGIYGSKWTWDNRREEEENVQEHIDRVVHLVLKSSNSDGHNRNDNRRPFIFEPYWIKDKDSLQIVQDNWTIREGYFNISCLVRNLEDMAVSLKLWSNRKFDHIPSKIKQILGKLDKAYEGPRDAQSLDNIRKLEKERDKLLWLEKE